MSWQNPPEAMCEGKFKHPTMASARNAARRVNGNRHTNAQGYHCRRCHGFHVGTSAAGTPQRRRAKPRRDEELA